MPFTVKIPPALRARVELPASKSLGNRALLLCELSGADSCVEGLTDCGDTLAMRAALASREERVDIGAAGTAMRFLTAYFAQRDGEERLLTGSARMLRRPVGVLVEALRAAGADIAYAGEEGFPPLRIRGRRLRGGEVSLPANVSSQYVSALLMVAPLMRGGLRLRLRGGILSRPYIEMTLGLMRRFGAAAGWTGEREISVPPGVYANGTRYTVERDWSAASYWYEMVALTPREDVRVELAGLRGDSLQGDAAVAGFFRPLGVATAFAAGGGAVLTKCPLPPSAPAPLTLDLSGQPDLAQTLVVACAALRRPFRFSGLSSLRIKETDRVAALRNELRKFGAELRTEGEGTLLIEDYPAGVPRYDGTPIETYDDHRMALAFAPLALRCPGLAVNHPEVVSKSYPGFWDALS